MDDIKVLRQHLAIYVKRIKELRAQASELKAEISAKYAENVKDKVRKREHSAEVTCKECGIKQTRNFMGYAKGITRRRPIYKDASGRYWNYYQCPDCKTGQIDEYRRAA